MPTLQRTGELVSQHMNDILGYFKPGAKIAVIVRIPGQPTQDFMMTNDALGELRELLDRRAEATTPNT